MKRLLTSYQQLLERLEQIKQYMDMTLSKNEALESIGKVLTNENDKNYIEYLKTLSTSTIQYNAVIISLYGCFENYIDNLLSVYINIVLEHAHEKEDIPVKMLSKYRKKVGEFLSAPQRFNAMDITENDIIADYHSILTSNFEEKINPKLFMAHSGNLHINEIINIMQDMGIENGGALILNSFLLKKHYVIDVGMNEDEFNVKKGRAASNITHSELLDPLERLVEQRNSVAHSWNEGNRITVHDLSIKTIPFLKTISKIVLEICLLELVSNILKLECCFSDKSLIKVYDNHIACLNSQGLNFKVFDFIIYKSNDAYKCSQIQNIQYNGVDMDTISDKQSIDIGLLLENTVKIDDEMYYLING